MLKVKPLTNPVRYEGVTYYVGDIFSMRDEDVVAGVVEVVEEEKKTVKKQSKAKTEVEGE